MFGGFVKINVVWSGCPLVYEPKSVTLERVISLTDEQEKKLAREINRIVDYKADARRVINEALGVKKDLD